ncbi:MAG: YjgP/YjgQ family permease [Spirulinaceae cyanobacterium RM2_2_10]|nr:YjgP/YjgQ family permease [Spirulinaceae cyanobacterium SM2_1_0]NJO20796.1 YjgP/YjgQ family permease [Spirulinaceae cyanobacterium RM2_2_10]
MAFTKIGLSLRYFPHLSILDRYLIGELLPPFLFGVGLFSSLGVAVGMVFDLVRRVTEYGLTVDVALRVMLLKLPEFVAYALPVALLLATLMTYSRLASDSELVALRSVGVSVYRLAAPALLLSIIVTGMTFLFNELVVPAANYRAAIALERALNDEAPSFQERNIFYPEYDKVRGDDGELQTVLKRLFYAEHFDGRNMEGLTILDRSRDGVDQIVTAKSAAWNFQDNQWDFEDGIIYLVSPDGSFQNILRFEQQQLQLPRTPIDLASRLRDNTEMNIAQSRDQLNLLRLSGDEGQIRKLRVRIHQKVSFPFVCLVFGLLGAALGTRPQHTSRATSFAISVVVVFGYYVLFFVTGALGLVGTLSPLLAAWLPNLFGIGAGSALLVQSAR